jgi:hypothetical protein
MSSGIIREGTDWEESLENIRISAMDILNFKFLLWVFSNISHS